MSLLREIQDSAIDSSSEVATLLRKCKVLGARLGSDEFKAWVDLELSGYLGDSANDLPDYRIVRVNSKGHFSGIAGSGISNADIPIGCLPEEFREPLSTAYLTDPVASIEALLKASDGSSLREPWSPDFVARYGRGIYQNMNCMQAWKVIPITGLVSMIDEIRNRILNFVLEIEAKDPAAGEALQDSPKVPAEQVSQIFNTYISGSVQNVAAGSSNFKQNAIQKELDMAPFQELIDALHAVNQPEITTAIINTVEEMKSSDSKENYKQNYLNFMSMLADHMQVLGPVVAPFLAALAAI